MLGTVLNFLGGPVANLIDKAVPDKDKALKLKHEIENATLKYEAEFTKAARDVVVAEAKSDFWLVAAWRPLMMLVFGAIIVATWFGWTDKAISESLTLRLLDIVEIGLGGYIIGRSAEKISKPLLEPLMENFYDKK